MPVGRVHHRGRSTEVHLILPASTCELLLRPERAGHRMNDCSKFNSLNSGQFMPSFRFTAVDSKGAEISGTVEASSEEEASSLIQSKGYFPTEIVDAAASKARKTKSAVGGKRTAAASGGGNMEFNMPSFMQRVSPKELMAFTRQLATLVNAGLPLVRGLKVLGGQEKNPLMRGALEDMSESIEGGSNFAEALVQHPRIFDKLYVNMVKAGEVGGVLDNVLESLAVFMEKMQKVRNKIKGAMIYPCVVLGMAVLILTFLMLVIIPKFEKIFADIMQGQELPWLTQQVVGFSQGFTLVRVIVFAVLFVAWLVALKYIKRSEKGGYVVDTIRLKAPLIGPLVKRSAIARFTRTLGELMNAGVPVLQALTIVSETSGNAVVSRGIRVVHDAVKEGENIAPTLASTGIFPPMVISMVEVGEETGELPQMLSRIADNYDDEVDNAVAGLTSTIEPLLIVFLALIVGVIVIALFLPLIAILNNM